LILEVLETAGVRHVVPIVPDLASAQSALAA
jgi:hypothetical protein